MVNPVLTILFDVFLIGSALAIIAGLVQEQRANRLPAVGSLPRTGREYRRAGKPSQISQYQARRRSPRRIVA